jgi:hypothetical protein
LASGSLIRLMRLQDLGHAQHVLAQRLTASYACDVADHVIAVLATKLRDDTCQDTG